MIALIAEIVESHDHLEHTKKKNCDRPNDPALVVANKQRRKLMDKYEKLWIDKYEEIRDRLITGVSEPIILAISKLRNKIAVLRHKKERLSKNLEQ